MPRLPKGKKKKWIASSKKKTGFTKEHISENSDFYNSRRWRELRKWHIERNPICEWCKEEGIINIKERIIHVNNKEPNPKKKDSTIAKNIDPLWCHIYFQYKLNVLMVLLLFFILIIPFDYIIIYG